jgi:hypothetical protein
MTHQQYFQCVIAALIGNLVHIAFKVLSLWKDHKKANLEFSLLGYLKDDKIALIVDVIGSFALVYIIDEWIIPYPQILSKIKTLFVFVGMSGSYVILQMFSVAKRKFRAAIDYKSTLADTASGTLDKPTPK